MVENVQEQNPIPVRRWRAVLAVVVLFTIAGLAAYRLWGARLPAVFSRGEVVGTVDGKELTRERFEEEVRLSEVKYELTDQPDREVNRPELLNRMIGDYLLIHGAEEAGVRVEDSEVEGEIDSILGRFQISREEMDRVLSDHMLRWQVFENSVWEYLMLNRYIDEVLLEDIPLNEQEAHLEAWMAERYSRAELEFDQAFLDEVNGGNPPGEL